MKERQYIEGPEALENFEQFARAILQAPKSKEKAKKKAKDAPVLKAKTGDKD
jgi:hypothetical protein